MNRPRTVAPAVAVVVLLALTGSAGCSERDPLRVGPPSRPSAAVAPSPTVAPAGTVWRLPGDAARNRPAEGVAVTRNRVAVGVDQPPQLVVLDARNGRPVRTVDLAEPPAHVVALPDGRFRTVAGRQLVTVPATGPVTRTRWSAHAHGLAVLPDGGTAVSFPEDGTIGVYDAGGDLRRTIRIGGHPDGVAADGDRIGVVDTEATSLTTYRAGTGKREQELRAGSGAVHLAAGPQGRLLVADTRDGELLVYSTGPLYLRQRYPLSGSPYGMAYDPRRQVLWVTLTARNEVVGLDVSGGAPREIARHATVRQPDSVAVDPASGTVYVAGRTVGLVQSISR